MSASTPPLTWVLETEVLRDRAAELQRAIRSRGQTLVEWRDDWLASGSWPALEGRHVVFHGSLRTAARVHAELPWNPGAWLDVQGFTCSNWFPQAAPWLVHREWQVRTVGELAASPEGCTAFLGSPEHVFLRADSPLKPFGGRVLAVSDITLEALDFGVSFRDASTDVVIAAARDIGDEWRFVVAQGEVVTGSQYVGDGTVPRRVDVESPAWAYAAEIARRLHAPEPVYALDVCAEKGEYRLLELNPFSGAELHAADPEAIVDAVARVLQG